MGLNVDLYSDNNKNNDSSCNDAFIIDENNVDSDDSSDYGVNNDVTLQVADSSDDTFDEDDTDSELGNNDNANNDVNNFNEVNNDSSSDDNDDFYDENEESSEDEVVQNIVARQNATSSNPNSIKVNTSATDISFSPDVNVIAVSDMEGTLFLYDIDDNSSKVGQIVVHDDYIRSIDFFEDGLRVASVSSNSQLCFTNIERKHVTKVDLNESDLEFILVKTLTKDLCLTGHENGIIKMWDVRVKSQIFSNDVSEEAINDIYSSSQAGRIHIVTSSGELLIYDMRAIRKNKHYKKSEPHTSELTSVTTLRDDRNIICGTSEGELLLFDYEPFGYQPYKLNTSKKEITSLVCATENIVVAGCENGNITACHLYPNQPVGLVGSHGKWDITRLDLNHVGNILASLAEDEIKFWDISYLENIEAVIFRNNERDKSKYALPSSQIMSRQEFFSDLNSDNT